MENSGARMDQYMEAVEAAASADKAKRWTQPVKLFGYIVIAIAAIIGIFGTIGGIAIITTQAPAQGFASLAASLVLAAVIFLQGAVVLMLAWYVQMRAEEVSMRVARLLEDDESE